MFIENYLQLNFVVGKVRKVASFTLTIFPPFALWNPGSSQSRGGVVGMTRALNKIAEKNEHQHCTEGRKMSFQALD